MDLIKTPHGWVYPDPGPCPCGETVATVGWEFCRCAGALDSGGHPAWRCRACNTVRTLGCVGRIEVPNEYGGRSGAPRARRNAPADTSRGGVSGGVSDRQ